MEKSEINSLLSQSLMQEFLLSETHAKECYDKIKSLLWNFLSEEGYFIKPILGEEKTLLENLNKYSKTKKTLHHMLEGTEIDIKTLEEKNTLASSLFQREPFVQQIPSPIDSDTERYQILETLGAGAMGVVHRVQDRLLGREVALKKILCQNSIQKNSKKQQALSWRLTQEACILSLLEHPNITPLYEMQLLRSGEIQFTMRKVNGKTLRQLLKEKKELSNSFEENTLFSIFLKVCEAVAYAHSRGIVHRDLKPDNIMIGNYGEVYVMDWGIAKMLYSQEFPFSILKKNNLEKGSKEQNPLLDPFSLQTVGSIGTFGYMSPEQCNQASQVTPTSDIYALGKILRECFLLTSPAEEFQSLLKSYPSKRSPSPKQNNRSEAENKIPPDIRAIIQKATAEKVEARYSQVQNLMDDIQRYQQNLRISVRKYNAIETLSKWIQRNRFRCVFALSILFASFSVWGYFSLEKLARFQEAYQKGLNGIQNATNASNVSTVSTLLLSALSSINEALSIYHTPDIEREKLHISTQLIQLACESKNYILAEYLGTELRSLSMITIDYKNKIKEKIQTEKNKTLEFHRVQLHTWLQLLQKRYASEEEKENAIFEISKMTEDEIRKQLIQLLEEQKIPYFLENNEENQLEEQFYEVVIKALGRLNHPESAPVLIHLLKEMSLHFSISSPPLHKINAMVLLASALEQTGATTIASEFLKIRFKMGENGLFWQRTRVIYQQMLKREGDFQKMEENEEDLFKQAILKLDQKKLAEAILDFEHLIQISPQSRYYYSCGNALLQKKEFEKAIQMYQEVLKINPEDIKALLNRGVAYTSLHKREEAFQDYQAILKKFPQMAEAYNNQGQLYLEMGQIETALQNFERAISFSPLSSEYYLNRGLARNKQRNEALALSDYDQAILFNPHYAEAYIARGQLKQGNKNYAGALSDYHKAICLVPDFPWPYFYRGQIRFAQGKYEGAILDFSQALEQEPTWERALFARGLSWYLQDEFQHAYADFESVLRQNPTSGEAYYHLGEIKVREKDPETAIFHFKNALMHNPKLSAAYFGLSKILKERNQINEALDEFERGLRLDSTQLENFLKLLSDQFRIEKTKENWDECQKLAQRLLQYTPEGHRLKIRIQKELEDIETKRKPK